jgi:hypothetical protein
MKNLKNSIKEINQLNKQLKQSYKDLIINLEKLEIENDDINKYKEKFITDIKQNNIDYQDINVPKIAILINNCKNLDITKTIDIDKFKKQNKKAHINAKGNLIQIYYPVKYGKTHILMIKFNSEQIIEIITVQKI